MSKRQKEQGFTINKGSGFQMTFENGYTVSVQFGQFHYCENRFKEQGSLDPLKSRQWNSNDAEIAAWGPDGEWVRQRGWGDDVKGFVKPDEVLKFMHFVANKKAQVEVVEAI